MSAEVDDVGSDLEQGLEQVVGADGPAGDQFQRVAVLRGPDLGGDLADFLVELQRLGAGRGGGEEEHFDLVHSVSSIQARSAGEFGFESGPPWLRALSLLQDRFQYRR